jgi:thioredoxin reductase (NADPH)
MTDGHNAYDCVVVGAGPAGLSAAIYLARFNRSALVVDQGAGRSTTHEVNENYLGFPDGIASRDLRERGREQAQRFGAEFVTGRVEEIEREEGGFRLGADNSEYRARSVILATGVVDEFPRFENAGDYVGKSLFWCITCDGYKVRGKRVMLVGEDDEAAVTCMQFLNFTDQLSFVTNRDPGESALTDDARRRLDSAGIPLYESCIAHVSGDDGMMHTVHLRDGPDVELDVMFSQQGARPNSGLAESLGVELSRQGYILCDEEQRTKVPLLYAAGDVTRIFAHQIVTAAHEGATAAQAANYDLYRPEQRSG